MAKNLVVAIPTAEQDTVTVSQYQDDIYVNFYHEVMVLSASEATALMTALGAAVYSVTEDN